MPFYPYVKNIVNAIKYRKPARMTGVLWLSLIWCFFVQQHAVADSEVAEVKIAEPFIELHTGPGTGYPVFHVIDRGEVIEVLKRKTDWFKVRYQQRVADGDDGFVEGWVARQAIELTVSRDDVPTKILEPALGDFSSRKWELGVVGGVFNESPMLTFYGGYAFNENLSAELSVSQVLGDYFSSDIVGVNVMSQPFPKWRYSPFFTLGLGQIKTTPHVTLVQVQDSEDLMAHYGLGIKTYLTRRFILRLDYKSYVAFSSDDDNEEFEEWKAGFAFFF